MRVQANPTVPLRNGETPEQILARCAAKLNCEPRQVYDRLLALLTERQTRPGVSTGQKVLR